MDKNDYRNTTYCLKLEKVINKKEELQKKIREEGHTTENFYELVRDKYRNEYLKIYNYKCAYCGVLILDVTNELMEIDHYKNKASFSKVTKAGPLDNLILSCKTCNRGKGKLEISGENFKKLNPDYEDIKECFYRDEDYSIKISEKYKNDIKVKEFYEKLKLNYEFRKIDFLLLNMDGLYDKLPKGELKTKLGELKGLLKNKRSLIKTKENKK